jgi:hypothetical protein
VAELPCFLHSLTLVPLQYIHILATTLKTIVTSGATLNTGAIPRKITREMCSGLLLQDPSEPILYLQSCAWRLAAYVQRRPLTSAAEPQYGHWSGQASTRQVRTALEMDEAIAFHLCEYY